MRRSTALAAVLATAAWSLAAPGNAQEWPTRTILLVAPFAPGGGIDASARVQVQTLSELLGQNVIIENVGGAGGTAGSLKVAQARPDGYTVLIGNSGTHAYSQSLYRKRPYDSLKDFEPAGLVTESARIVIGRKDLPVSSFAQFVAYAKANQDKMHFGSAGVGSSTHLPCALLNMTIGVKIEHVPFRGAGPVLQELMAGRIDYMCDGIQTGAPRSKAGSVKGLAVMSPKRLAIIPELETTAEGGVPGVEVSVWNAYFFPKGTPKAIVARFNGAVGRMLERPDIRQKMEALGLDIVPAEQRTPEHLARLLAQEVARWGKVVQDAGIVPE